MPTPEKSAEQLLQEILDRDRRYQRDAYAFVSQALNYTGEKIERKGHITGRELCEGLRDFALREFGRLARTVLESWGVRSSEDIGEIVFNMVDVGLLKKTDEDTREDFAGALDFTEAFDRGFRIEIIAGDDDDGKDDG
jgi:uncharacterized repeat protein (TIGR04138 family)